LKYLRAAWAVAAAMSEDVWAEIKAADYAVLAVSFLAGVAVTGLIWLLT